MAMFYTGEHKSIRWRGVVESKRVVVQAGDANKTWKFGREATADEVKKLAEQLIDYSLT